MGAQLAIAERCGSEHKSPSRAQIIFQMLVLCLLLMLLIDYKGAAGLNKIRQTLTAGRPSVRALPIDVRAASMTAFRDAVGYVKIVWPALVFGVLSSAALRTSTRIPVPVLGNAWDAYKLDEDMRAAGETANRLRESRGTECEQSLQLDSPDAWLNIGSGYSLGPGQP